MSEKSDTVQRARKELIQQTLDKIREIRDFRKLKRTTFVVLAHIWLHNIAKKEGLFELDEWVNSQHREILIEKIKDFLNKYIK